MLHGFSYQLWILQEKLLKDFQESLSVALNNFQNVLEANDGGQGFFVGKKVELFTAFILIVACINLSSCKVIFRFHNK